MISQKNILVVLNELDSMYNNAKSNKKKIYFSKLAVLELCGWIEKSFDTIAITYTSRRIKEADNKKHIKKVIVHRNYGFDYDENIRKMFMPIVGLKNLEFIEKTVEKGGKITILRSKFNTLKLERNKAAHTFTNNIGITFNAPSVTIADFMLIYSAIIEFDKAIRKI